MSEIRLPLKNLIYSPVEFSEIKTKSQIKLEEQVKELKSNEYYSNPKPISEQTKDAINSKNIDKLTALFLHDFRDEQLCRALAKATIYPKGNVEHKVPTKKDNEAFFRKREKRLKKLNIKIKYNYIIIQ